MKSKLYLKIFSGPLLGSLKSDTQFSTGDINEAIIHILAALKKCRLNADHRALRLKLRRFRPDGMIADGYFDDRAGSFGYFAYAPRTFRAAQWDAWLASSLDPVQLYRAFASQCSDALFSERSLPVYKELPESIAVVWSASSGVVPIPHGH